MPGRLSVSTWRMKSGVAMLGFTDVQADGRVSLLRRDSFKQLVELLERIGLQAVEIGIQFYKSGLGA